MKANDLVVGNLSLEDDLMHAVSEDSSFNESMFFNLFDAKKRLGGFVRIGNRANEGHAEMTFCLFLPGGELLMQWARAKIDSNLGFETAGMKFEVVEPGKRIAISYAGQAVRIKDPLEMREPGKAMRGNPSFQVDLRLDVVGTGPMIGDSGGDAENAVIFLNGVGHYQQPIAATGKLTVGSDAWGLSMVGVRDHSWGRRVWSSIYKDRSIWISFGAEQTFIACKTWLDPDAAPDEMGCIVEHGQVTPLRSIIMHTHFTENSYYHDAVRLELEDAGGRSFVIDGTVLAYVPLRHRTPGHDDVYLGQAMTRFTFGGRETVGLSEYFDAAPGTPRLIEQSRTGKYLAE